MKMILTALALATALASPALAQTRDRVDNSQMRGVSPYNGQYGAYPNQDGRRHTFNPANDVYDTRGHYIGSDPDPSVRGQLARDPTGSE